MSETLQTEVVGGPMDGMTLEIDPNKVHRCEFVIGTVLHVYIRKPGETRFVHSEVIDRSKADE